MATSYAAMTSNNISVGDALDRKTKDGVRFGKELREKEFMFAKGYLNLNHGEYCFFFRTCIRFALKELGL